jgi:hypothetical protein
MIFNLTNLILGSIIVVYLIVCSKYIGQKNTIIANQFYLLFLLICVLITYPYNKQIGITLLLIAMISHSPVFKEAFVDYMGNETSEPNELETRESNYINTIDKRKKDNLTVKLNQEEKKMNIFEEEGIISPLEKDIVREIQRQFEEDIDMIMTDDFSKLLKYTDEGDPINAGLLPKEIDSTKYGLDYNQLVRTGQIIKF